jgi:hypothetical protein
MGDNLMTSEMLLNIVIWTTIFTVITELIINFLRYRAKTKIRPAIKTVGELFAYLKLTDSEKEMVHDWIVQVENEAYEEGLKDARRWDRNEHL